MDGRALQAVKRLRQVIGRVRTALLQPPLHERDLRSRQIVCQHAKRDSALGFGKDGTQVRLDRKSTRLNSSHIQKSRMPSSA